MGGLWPWDVLLSKLGCEEKAGWSINFMVKQQQQHSQMLCAIGILHMNNRKVHRNFQPPSDEEIETPGYPANSQKQRMPQLFPSLPQKLHPKAQRCSPYLIIVGDSSSLGESTLPAVVSLSSKLPLRLVLSPFSFLAANLVSSISINRSLY